MWCCKKTQLLHINCLGLWSRRTSSLGPQVMAKEGAATTLNRAPAVSLPAQFASSSFSGIFRVDGCCIFLITLLKLLLVLFSSSSFVRFLRKLIRGWTRTSGKRKAQTSSFHKERTEKARRFLWIAACLNWPTVNLLLYLFISSASSMCPSMLTCKHLLPEGLLASSASLSLIKAFVLNCRPFAAVVLLISGSNFSFFYWSIYSVLAGTQICFTASGFCRTSWMSY